MKGKIIILLAITFIGCISAMAFIPDDKDSIQTNNREILKDSDKTENNKNVAVMENNFPKSKLTLAVLFLGGVGLAVFRRNSFV